MTKNALDERKEYERIAFDKTLQEMIDIVQENKRQREEAFRAREKLISERMAKLAQWKTELKNKIAKREQVALEAKVSLRLLDYYFYRENVHTISFDHAGEERKTHRRSQERVRLQDRPERRTFPDVVGRKRKATKESREVGQTCSQRGSTDSQLAKEECRNSIGLV